MVSGSGLGESRVPQSLGMDQRVEDHPTILGVALGLQKARKDVPLGTWIFGQKQVPSGAKYLRLL
jgi:hypothetical protein